VFHDHIARVDAVSGAPDAGAPDPWSDVYTMMLTPDGSQKFIGGSFTTVNGQPKSGVALISTAGSGVASWVGPTLEFPDLPSSMSVDTLALSLDNASLYVGGIFTQVNGVFRNGLIKVDVATGQ